MENAAAGQLELQLGHLCNNRCVFCVSGQLSELGLARQTPLEPILAALAKAAAAGVRKVTFLGGEPTSQRSFIPALQRAVQLGFNEIVIFTNGVTSANRSFMEKILAMGAFTWRFSIQGGTEEAHDAVTQVPGSFRRIVAGLTLLQERRQRVTSNTCVNELNYRSLPLYPRIASRFDIRELHFDMVRPANAGARSDDHLRSILPRFSDIAPYIREMLEEFEHLDSGLEVNVGNLPYCVLPEWQHRIHHGGEETAVATPDEDGRMQSFDKYARQWSDMVYGPRCHECALKPDCRGVPSKYAEFYGFDELQPLAADSIAALGGRAFTRALDPLITRLSSAEPPSPWRLRDMEVHSRDGLVVLRYAAASAAATIVLSHQAVGELQTLWETARFRVSALTEPTAHLPSLLAWLHATLHIAAERKRCSSDSDRINDAPASVGSASF